MNFASIPAILSMGQQEQYHKEESTMSWEQRFCPNQACADRTWMVQRAPKTYDVWAVAAHVDDNPFTVAAIDPVCPHCGTTLLRMVKLEGRLGHAGPEMEPVFDFARSLSHSNPK
jgi:hypothetical protein